MAISFQVITGPAMLYTLDGVVQIFNNASELINQATAEGDPLVSDGRPSLTLLSMFMRDMDSDGDDGLASFQVYVPKPLDLSNGDFVGSSNWQPIMSITPMNSAAADFSDSKPVLKYTGSPDPVTRLLNVTFQIASIESCDFIICVDFKHSII